MVKVILGTVAAVATALVVQATPAQADTQSQTTVTQSADQNGQLEANWRGGRGGWGRGGWGRGGWGRGGWGRRGGGWCYWHPYAPACRW